jgi:hypothetical protein
MDPTWQDDVIVDAPIAGLGLIYEANEVARCVRGQCLESGSGRRKLIIQTVSPKAQSCRMTKRRRSWDRVVPVRNTLTEQIFDLVREQNGHHFEEGRNR